MRVVFIVFSLMIVLFQGCKKEPGEGGNATIKGSVWVKDYNSTYTLLQGEYAGADEDIYLIYGDEAGYGDKVSADYKGCFSFKYLRPGKYTVYVYSKDSSLQTVSGEVAIVSEVEINKRNETIELPQIVIIK